MSRISILIVLLFHFVFASGQDAGGFYRQIDSLGSTIYGSVPDSIRIAANQNLEEILSNFLTQQDEAVINGDSLKFIKAVAPEDGLFRIYTWAVPLNNGDHIYSGLITKYDDSHTLQIISLKEGPRIEEDEKFNAGNWPGAVYFELIEKRRNKKNFYTLLGWRDGGEGQSARVIEAMQFDEYGNPVFGLPVFGMKNGKTKNRILFTFTDQVPFHLAWEEQILPGKKRKTGWMIVFNHLSGNNPELGRMFRGAVPSYDRFDAFLFSDGRWHYVEDVDVRAESRKYEPPEEIDLGGRR